ncbi:MAG: G-D-S-L family lipolytic protein [Oscillatoriales cyanobacterium C42_A2020_001]|nr:G-D-S-L family lipolytic protein [Leptolyngbyaceae cyanobacterium C42_A2020_001]
MTKRFIAFSRGAILPGVVGGVLILATLLLTQRVNLTGSSQVNASTIESSKRVDPAQVKALRDGVAQLPMEPTPGFGLRRELTYEQWVTLLKNEAAAIAQKHPDSLHILAGDSLSLWFPSELLPSGGTWLNQGISGETSYGLLRRVKLFDRNQPQTIFVMIGINDLIRGVRDETLLANQREIIRHLKTNHPKATIVVQSILPHGGDRASRRYWASVKGDPAVGQNPHPLWVKRLPIISNRHIRKLNQRLSTIAKEEKVQFLDLHHLFADEQGYLHDSLTTDGLHLSYEGYALWRSQLERFLPQPSQATVSH